MKTMFVLVNDLWVPLDIELSSNYFKIRWCENQSIYDCFCKDYFDNSDENTSFWEGFYSVFPELFDSGLNVFYMPYSRMPTMQDYD